MTITIAGERLTFKASHALEGNPHGYMSQDTFVIYVSPAIYGLLYTDREATVRSLQVWVTGRLAREANVAGGVGLLPLAARVLLDSTP